MAPEIEHLPADVLGLAPFARDALAGRPRPAGLPGTLVPGSLDTLPRCASALDEEERAELSAALERELARHEPHVSVLESARALARPGASLVIAGQQPGLLGGPLFNVYKAVHVIRLAHALTAEWGTPVLPAFWNHGDDHDVAEVHHLWLLNPNLDLRKVGLAGVSSGRAPVSRIVFDSERHQLDTLAELLRQNLWEGPERERSLELFLPRAGESFAGAFTRVLLELFGHHGLLVIEPDWIREPLSRALAHVVTADVEPALASGVAALDEAGFTDASARIDPTGAALVFRLIDGRRHALRLRGGELAFDDEPGSRTATELAAEIVAEPAAYSPGALLRPVAQDLCLPVAAYVGGWGELAYHAQLPPLRRNAGAPETPFVPRLSATLVDAATRGSLSKLDLDLRRVLGARGVPEVEDEGPPVAGRLREAAERSAQEILATRDELAGLEPGLAQQAKRTANQLRAVVEKLAGKAERVHANARGGGQRHARRVANGLVPRGEPQERVRGALEFCTRAGRGWIEDLLGAVEPLPTEHVVLHLHDN